MSMLLQLIQEQLTDAHVASLAKHAGIQPDQAQGAISEALPLLLGAVSQRATGNTGLQFLTNLLDRNHDGSVLDDILGMVLSGGGSSSNRQALQSILGNQGAAVEQRVAAQSGVPADSIARLLPLLAPIVLGALTKAQTSQGLEGKELSTFLEKERSSLSRQAPEAHSFLGSLLDKNHDGSVVDDVVRMGGQALSKFLK